MLASALAQAKAIHESLMPLSATIIRDTPSLGTDGKITPTPAAQGTTPLDINPATLSDSKIAKATGIEISAPYFVARLPLAADIHAEDKLLVGSTTWRVKGITRVTSRSVIRRAFLQEEA